MFDIDHLMKLGVFNQLIPIWQIFFFIASLLPFLLIESGKNLPVDYLSFYLLFGLHGPMGRLYCFHRIHAALCALLAQRRCYRGLLRRHDLHRKAGKRQSTLGALCCARS